MDSRAHGRSPSSSANITYDLMTSDVVSLLDYLGLSKIHLVGWSDGGIIGLNLAMNHPDRLYSLFAFAAHYDSSGGNNAPMPSTFVAYFKRAQAEYEEFNPNKPYEIFLNDLLTMWSNYPKWTRVDFEKIPSDLPVWIVAGDHEEVINREQTDTMASWIPQAGELILPRTSHFAFIQEPTRFTIALEQFLAEVTNTTTCSNYHFQLKAEELIGTGHRLSMIYLAIENIDWIMIDLFEMFQPCKTKLSITMEAFLSCVHLQFPHGKRIDGFWLKGEDALFHTRSSNNLIQLGFHTIYVLNRGCNDNIINNNDEFKSIQDCHEKS
ncbi:unnamed protein product [Rotaria sordida]|uniref:AB hydrolase-1 domain-containing protein n=1 Tax=Rotaria sordida TaxID=392033 RepID=A0A818Y2X8_9BILA|nr:unnamed protein product [Rotaria sordida]CAF3744802.1 unnamed protein product [Rotaria sordida]